MVVDFDGKIFSKTKRSYEMLAKFLEIMCPSRSTVSDSEDSTGIKIFLEFGFFTIHFNTFNLDIGNHKSSKNLPNIISHSWFLYFLL